MSKTPRASLRHIVRVEAGAWGVMRVINDAFIQPLLISRGASQLALGLYISGSSLFNFGAGWVGPTLATRVGNTAKTTLASLGIARAFFIAFTVYLLLSDTVKPEILIVLILLWGIGEGLALPLWTSFLAGMVEASERGRWVAMRAQAATITTVPVLVAILILVLFASKETALPIAYSVAGAAAVISWFALREMFRRSPEQPVPPKRSLTHVPESTEARRFLGGVFLFWFASALTWPIVPRYITTELDAPTAYFAVSQIIGACVGVVMQPRWGRLADASGARRVLLLSGIGSSTVPLWWVLAPVFWFGFGIDTIAFIVWPGHMLGLTLRAVELCDSDADRPMMLGWTNLAQGAGASISPLLAAILVSHVGVAAILIVAAALRLLGTLVLSGNLWSGESRPQAEPTS